MLVLFRTGNKKTAIAGGLSGCCRDVLLRVPAAIPPPGAGMAKVKKAGKESVAHGVVRVWSN
jgi:hypothetical protein